MIYSTMGTLNYGITTGSDGEDEKVKPTKLFIVLGMKLSLVPAAFGHAISKQGRSPFK